MCWAAALGLMQGAGIRIVTPSSRLGMPEINIGLYPDVGGSWFLARLPGRLELFLGLTAASINARDALDLNLADRCLRDDQQDALLEGLVQLNWREQADLQLHNLLRALENEARSGCRRPNGCRAASMSTSCSTSPTCPPPVHAISACRRMATPCSRAAKTLAHGCPLAHLVWEQVRRARHLSLAEVFRMEYAASLNSCRHPEFPEGVRARLIDGIKRPHWHWPDVAAIPAAVVEARYHRPGRTSIR